MSIYMCPGLCMINVKDNLKGTFNVLIGDNIIRKRENM